MHISKLYLKGYKNTAEESTIVFNRGLNVLLGENGCGKSTTLKLLTRIIYPDAGSIEMCGRVSSLIELGAGFHPDFSGRENIYINAAIFGLSRKEIEQRIDDIITFSELEEMQNLNSGMTLQRASALVGQYVYLNVTDSSGKTTYPEGKVDYVQYENNKAYLSVNGTLYSIDDLESVTDMAYHNAMEIAEAFVTELYKLPKPEYVAQTDLAKIEAMITIYENMTSYEKEFLGDDNTALYKKYAEKYRELAITPVSNFITDLNKLPKPEEATMDNVGAMHAVIKTYDNFSDYQKGLINEESLAAYNAMLEKYNELTTA